MVTGQTLGHTLNLPRGELAMWSHWFRENPPGDPIVRVQLAKIGMLLERLLAGGTDPANWFFWLQRNPAEVDAERERREEETVDLARQHVLGMVN